jgi:hypothetical protein
MPMLLENANQLLDALIMQNEEGTGCDHTLWARLDRAGETAATVNFGYGLRINWEEGGTRSLEFLKIPYNNGGVAEVLLKRTITSLVQEDRNDGNGASDLGVVQRLRFMVVDVVHDNNLPEQEGVVLRAYINNSDLGLPELEFIDRGVTQSPGVDTGPPWRGFGTWAIEFGKASQTFYDSVAFTDTYVVPAFGVYQKKNRTLDELRTAVTRKITLGGHTQYETDTLDQAINFSLLELKAELGDKALFWRKLVKFELTSDDLGLVTLPEDVDRVLEVYRYEGGPRPVLLSSAGWEYIVDDDRGRNMVEIYRQPQGQSYVIFYMAAFTELVNDTDICPVPKEHDEAVVLGAALRIVGETEFNPERAQALTARWKKAVHDVQKLMSRKMQSSHPAMRIHMRTPRSRGNRAPWPNDWWGW